MVFHVSAGTIFSPAGLHSAGRDVGEALNHTSSNFSGPAKV